VSHWEDPIDFKKVAADGIVAIIAKATQGATGVDPAYAEFKRAAGAVRLPSTPLSRRSLVRRRINQRLARGAVLSTNNFLLGSYHFGTGADVNPQVEHYLATVKPKDNELVCLDFEENPSGSSMTLSQAKKFVSLFKQRTGRYPILYGGAWLKENLNGKPDPILSKCALWLSQYGPKPVLPPGWKKYVLWQYTDGQLGVAPHEVNAVGSCDRNQFAGTIQRLTACMAVWPRLSDGLKPFRWDGASYGKE
jgi:lysozyme